MDTINVGVVGLGHLGRHHLRIYSDLEGARLVGGYDINMVLAEERCGALGTKAFTTYEALLDEVQALNIAVPTTGHFEAARKALARGIHVLIEKPITCTVEEADILIEEAQRRSCVLQVGHIERFNRALRAIQHLPMKPAFIEARRLAPYHLRGTDVSVVHDLMIHDIDIILSLVNSPLEQIDAVGASVVSTDEDMANARLHFANGCAANITASRIATQRIRNMRIFQPDACIDLDFAEGRAEIFRLVDSENTAGAHQGLCHDFGEIERGARRKRILCERPTADDTVDALTLELRSFLQAVRTGDRPIVSGQDGRRALEVVHRIIQQVQEHSARFQP